MNKENTTYAKDEEPPVRMTRARAKTLSSLGGIPPSSRPSFKHEKKQRPRANPKRAASDTNKTSVITTAGLQHKKRAVLNDVTNISNEKICLNSINISKAQASTKARGVPTRKQTKAASDVPVENKLVQEDVKTKLAEELSKIRMVEAQESTLPVKLEEEELVQQDIDMICDELGSSRGPGIVDIDSDLKDSQLWSLYAPDIYDKICVTELERRPSTKYMEKLQQDITPTMRGVLIDWLVEVSEEYKLVPDTLYLTVNLIDRFLSRNLIEKQRLQLLGITCMLLASKYEEICAPRVEEFCFITDNTYTRGEVLKMESEVLNFLHFQLSIPTTKSFLRRFIQASQSSYKAPCVEMEFLANYLAELTLLEYSFLKFLPSLIAASAVFLARWTFNQSDHPWNSTLRHYTSYSASDLKTTVLALEDLQLNTKCCSLNAVREKYKQQKFKFVANLTSGKPVQTLFY
ncbi:Cyclin [Quillaja saponaria]|uniref:B-like cyclin n=1 Tax=Quillaja saponaria TaxID=32244 RepID=A0AAD7LXG1_QUISA|nr:Cyclin [Quillaja saponaria]